jgi:formamidopyrimidine-DNA glycosylase
MPELPEVQTTVNGLNKKVLSRAFVDVWSDWEKLLKKPNDFNLFKKQIKNKKIVKIYRRAKNIIINLQDNHSLLIHLKMTGHLLVGKWQLIDNIWKVIDKTSPLNDPYNRFLHIIFFLNNKEMLALSDARKFAKIELWQTKDLEKELQKLGPEPLENDFTFTKFKNCFNNKRGKIKQILMIPEIIAGIGNIYSSEILWHAKINPEKLVQNLNDKELKEIYNATKKVLTLGVNLGGESFSDYRKVDGTKGDFDDERKVYKRENEICLRCKKSKIKRIKIAGRSAFFCSYCQKL